MPSFRLPPRENSPKVDLGETIGTPGSPYPNSVTPPTKEPIFSSERQIPYRGAEDHGVALTTDLSQTYNDTNEIYTPGDDKANVVVPEPISDFEYGAVPVRIIAGAPPVSLRKRFTAYTVSLPVGAGSQRIAAFQRNRTKLRIQIKALPGAAGTDRVWIGNDEGFASASAYPLDLGDPPFDSNTTDDVWATVLPGGTNGALVCVYNEFEIEALTAAEQGADSKHHAKHH